MPASLRHYPADRGFVGDIDGQGLDGAAAADRALQRAQRVDEEIAGENLGAVGGKGSRNGLPDPPRRSGNNDLAPVKANA